MCKYEKVAQQKKTNLLLYMNLPIDIACLLMLIVMCIRLQSLPHSTSSLTAKCKD